MENTNTPQPKDTAANKSYQEERMRTRRYIFTGAAWILGGCVLIVIAHIRGSGYKAHIVIWGAFLFGGFQFTRGIFRRLMRLKR